MICEMDLDKKVAEMVRLSATTVQRTRMEVKHGGLDSPPPTSRKKRVALVMDNVDGFEKDYIKK